MKLLMVNDAEAIVNAMKDSIDWISYGIDEVFVAYNVVEGRDIISQNTIDILLCDIEMPGEYGIALIRWIRENNYDIDCILLTCHAEFEYAHEAITLNCHDYLLLPASYNTIGETVKSVVFRRAERFQNTRLQEYGKSWLKSKENKVQIEESNSKTPKEIVDECTSYILQHLNDEDMGVNELASLFHLSPIYLNRIFKKEKKIAISQFIIREKMSLAAQLLKKTDSSAVAVANQVGYPNYSYFTTVFKKYYGCTPIQYRDSNESRLLT